LRIDLSEGHVRPTQEEKNYVVWPNFTDYHFSDFLSGPIFGLDAAGTVAGENYHTDRNDYSGSALSAATPIDITHLVMSN
jgi:hypothetical protein